MTQGETPHRYEPVSLTPAPEIELSETYQKCVG